MNPSFRPLLFCVPLAVFFVLQLSSARVHAFGGPPGGPFSNGSYFPNDGTFSAVVRGTNLTGTLQFSTTSGAGSETQTVLAAGEGRQELADLRGGRGSTGIANIYYNGNTYQGNSQGAYNPESSGMTVTFQAQSIGLGNGTLEVQTRYVSTSTTNGTTTTTQQVLPRKTLNYYDSKTINGFANCKTSNAFPNQKFKGSGEAFARELDFKQGNSDPVVNTFGPLKLSVSGVRLSNQSANFNTTSIIPPSVVNTTILSNP